jgi:hypothetical protein
MWRWALMLSAAFGVGLLAGTAFAGDKVPVRVDFPPGAGGEIAVPVAGGIPFPKGALKSVDNLHLLGADGKEVPAQVTQLATWPDGSVKWALIDAVLTPSEGKALTVEYGPDVTRAPVTDPLTAEAGADGVHVKGGGVAAAVLKTGGGVVDELTLGGRQVFAPGSGASLVLNTVRIKDGTSGDALPANTYLLRDPSVVKQEGKVAIDEVALESSGPIRVTVRVRGKVLLPHYGETLPDAVKQRDPAGEMPFSVRVSFYRNTPVIYGQHQIVFSGEPDCDYIADWGIRLPGLTGERGRLILDPGVELDVVGWQVAVAKEQTRLAWAPIAGGFALIRQGWENRPVAISQTDKGASIDFWPQAAGVWDLRRYAREWGVGETASDEPDANIQFYSKYAARGMAKSHDFVLYLGGDVPAPEPAPALVRTLSGRALLVAPPGWYGASNALGYFPPEQTAGPFAEVDGALRRTIDYYLFSQDLYHWYGKLAYGDWQTRYGEMHRNDRWEMDYGRWAWGLNDGAGRVGHMVMLAYLRTLERRYFDAGEAFNRIIYDTNMVHTWQHLENTRPTWWTVKGSAHRHNVQPFGCPYIGMRGSNPGGHRILYFLTGDGIIKDGLEIVADAAVDYAKGQTGRFGASGGSDGEGSGALALLWAYETTGDKSYAEALASILDKSGLVPPKGGTDLDYSAAFGLFNAAGEYADLSGEVEWKRRVTEVGRLSTQQKNPGEFLYAIVTASRLAGGSELTAAIQNVLATLAKGWTNSLAETPPDRWPGHGGVRVAPSRANEGRDVPYALGALVKFSSPGPWPQTKPNLAPIPAKAPADWYHAGGQPGSEDVAPEAQALLAASPTGTTGELRAGQATWTVKGGVVEQVAVAGVSALVKAMEPFAEFAEPGSDPRLAASYKSVAGVVESSGVLADGSAVAKGKVGSAAFALKLRPVTADAVPAVRVEMALQAAADSPRVATWGVRIPLRLGADKQKIQLAAPGTFRVERWRVDQNDEKLPEWLRSDPKPDWPLWRIAGVSLGSGGSYRIWKANRADTSPLFPDEGVGSPGWLDITDRSASQWWGVTVRVLRPAKESGLEGQAVRADLESGMLAVQFHDPAREPVPASAAQAGLAGAADVIFHDGWRPPLGKPELTRDQYQRFLADLDIGANYGLFALRFAFSDTHMVTGPKSQWTDKLTAGGIEPREILYSMYPDQLKEYCQKISVPYRAEDQEGTVHAVIDHYRK